MIVKVPDVAWFQFPFVKFIRAKIPTNRVIRRYTGDPPSSLFFPLTPLLFCGHGTETEWQGAVCMSLECQRHCQGLSQSRGMERTSEGEKGKPNGGKKKGFNKTLSGVTWALPSSSAPPPPATPWHCASNIQRALRAQRRESRLTLPISYCLSVSLILSGGGQLPFWTAVSRHILAGRLAANKSQPGIYFSFPFYL